MAKSKKDFTLLLIALVCSSLAHAQKQVPAHMTKEALWQVEYNAVCDTQTRD